MPDEASAGQMTLGQRRAVGVLLILTAVVLLYSTFELLATPLAAQPGADAIVFGRFAPPSTDDSRMLLLVMLSGAVGGYVHSASSFVTFAGNRRLYASWMWWYGLRVFIGASLALVMYLVIRGGLLVSAPDVDASVLNRYAIAGLSAMVGMFSKQATDKLRDLFDEMFRTRHQAPMKDRLEDQGANAGTGRS